MHSHPLSCFVRMLFGKKKVLSTCSYLMVGVSYIKVMKIFFPPGGRWLTVKVLNLRTRGFPREDSKVYLKPNAVQCLQQKAIGRLWFFQFLRIFFSLNSCVCSLWITAMWFCRHCSTVTSERKPWSPYLKCISSVYSLSCFSLLHYQSLSNIIIYAYLYA